MCGCCAWPWPGLAWTYHACLLLEGFSNNTRGHHRPISGSLVLGPRGLGPGANGFPRSLGPVAWAHGAIVSWSWTRGAWAQGALVPWSQAQEAWAQGAIVPWSWDQWAWAQGAISLYIPPSPLGP